MKGRIYLLTKKTVILGVTGSIAAYKSAAIASGLKKQHADIHVLMTKNSENFIHPITFETLTGNKCVSDTFDRSFEFQVNHVSLAKRADVLLIAPASANVIAKLAHGIADDMLTTTALACKCPKLLSPAMNTNMYENPLVQENLKTLRKFGWKIIEPDVGYLACGDTGTGKMPEPEVLLQAIYREIAHEKDMAGLRVLVSAGATREAIDPVRFITNHSSGKMGYALAENAMRRGAQVTLVTGAATVSPPLFVECIPVVSAQDMLDAIVSRQDEQDIIIKAAAVADYRPTQIAEQKIKKGDGEACIPLTRTTDILKTLGENRKHGGNPNQFLCGFSMETEHLLENSRKKLESKQVDMIVANSLRQEGAGFGGDTNQVTILTKQEEIPLPLLSKQEAASRILSEILRQYHQ